VTHIALGASRDNPSVAQKCGLNVALILDQSGSMAGAKQTTLKQAANDTVDALALPDTDPLAHTGMDPDPTPIRWGLFFGVLAIATEMMRRRSRK